MEAPLHFVFPNEVLAYDCVTCGAKCCRGHNTTFGGTAELVQLLRHRPSLAPFVYREPGRTDEIAMQTFEPACALMTEDNRCGVEEQLGREAKPMTCRLFPVDRFTRIGRYVFVDVHMMCPLGLAVDLGPQAYIVDYATTRRELAEVECSDLFDTGRVPARSQLDELSETIVNISTELRSGVEASFQDGDFEGCLRNFAEFLDGLMGEAPDPIPASIHGTSMRSIHEEAAAYFGHDLAPLQPEDDLRLRRTLLATVCSFHHKILLNQKLKSQEDLLRYSRRFTTTMIGLEYLFRTFAGLNPARIRVATVTDILMKNGAVASLLGSLRSAPVARPVPPQLRVPPQLKEIVERLLLRLKANNNAELGTLLRDVDVPLADRGTTLRWLANHQGVLFEYAPAA